MGCLYVFLIIGLIVLIITVGIAILPFIASFFLITSFISYNKSKNLKSTEMICPNCYSNDIKINSLQTGFQSQGNVSGGSNSIGFDFLGFRTFDSFRASHQTSTTYNFKREGICQKCGFNFDYYTDNDVVEIQKKYKIRFICSIIFVIIALIISFNFWSAQLNNSSTNNNTIESLKLNNLI